MRVYKHAQILISSLFDATNFHWMFCVGCLKPITSELVSSIKNAQKHKVPKILNKNFSKFQNKNSINFSCFVCQKKIKTCLITSNISLENLKKYKLKMK